jgi:hypothetical protein
MRQGLVAAVGWATRGLDPFGQTPLADIAGLPTICAHRDVNPTSCPGDALYDDLAWLRDEVANANAGTRDVGVQRFAAGDGVATTAEGVALREAPGTAATTVATIAVGERLAVADGPVAADGFAWYLVEGVSLSGWAAADYLTAITPTGDPEIAVGGTSPADPSELSRWASLPEGATAEVTGGDLLLRDAPAGGVVETLPDGAWVAVIGAPEERSGTLWYPVDTGLGSVGWVSGDYLSPA